MLFEKVASLGTVVTYCTGQPLRIFGSSKEATVEDFAHRAEIEFAPDHRDQGSTPSQTFGLEINIEAAPVDSQDGDASLVQNNA